jgi:hypothetical protein
MGGAVYLIWFSPLFKIQSLEVKGATAEEEALLRQTTVDNILFWRSPLAPSKFPEIAKLNIKKDFIHHKITLEVIRREKAIIWCLEKSNQCFWADNSGFIFSAAPTPTGSLLVRVIKDGSDRDLKIGDEVLPASWFVNLQSIFALLDELNLSIDEIRLENLNYRELKVKTVNGPDLYFSLLFDPHSAKEAIRSLAASNQWSSLRYLDLRVENKLYYSL